MVLHVGSQSHIFWYKIHLDDGHEVRMTGFIMWNVVYDVFDNYGSSSHGLVCTFGVGKSSGIE